MQCPAQEVFTAEETGEGKITHYREESGLLTVSSVDVVTKTDPMAPSKCRKNSPRHVVFSNITRAPDRVSHGVSNKIAPRFIAQAALFDKGGLPGPPP